MTTEERDARLTAYALNDPGVTPAARQEIEAMLANDPAARQAVEETRRLAQVLTAALAAEQAAMPAESAVTIPATKPVERNGRSWTKYIVAAAAVLVAFGGTYLIWSKWKTNREDWPERIVETSVARVAAGTEEPNDRESLEGYPRSREFEPKRAYPRSSSGGEPDENTKALEEGPRPEPRSKGNGAGGGGYSRPSFDPAMPAPTEGTTRPAHPLAPGGTTKGPASDGAPGPGGPGVPGRSRTADLPDQPAAPGTPTPEKARPREGDDKADGKPEPGFQPPGEDPQAAGNDRYPHLRENGFIRVHGENALSTFGVDVDTASYAIVRKYLTSGQMPPANAIRLEEMVNYFPYADKAPEGDDPFAVRVEMAECPWEPAHRLVRLGLKAKPVETDKRPPSNLVFLIDVSGSMDAPNRLPLVKASLKLLVDQLGEKDRVAMVVYAGASGLVLDSTPATRKETILGALDSLSAGGSTNGAGGIQQAYEVAVANFIKGGTNRVILCTDGDWNVGTTSTEALVKLIEDKRETGVFLSVFGFGMGNLRDEMLVKLAGKGNGNYGYIDTLREAHKAFVEQIGGTLITVAKDVKIQVEFNPAVIKSYRLLGYEKRALAAKDFHDDKKDAGEMGAGHVVTALYELVPTGAPDPVAGKVDPLRYQPEPPAKVEPKAIKADEAFIVKMRHKKPDGDTSTLRELPVKDVTLHYEKASEDFQFAASVASFAMLLRDSPYKGGSSYALVLELAEAAKKHDPSGYRAEFIELVRKAKTLSGKP